MKRNTYWDSAKFVLIFLVVYTHTISPYRPDSQFNAAFYNLVYSFHMPLFIFISGRFSHIRNKEKYKSRTIKLLETYLVFQLFFIAISFLSGKSLSISYFTKPFWIYWYLLALVYWRLMVYFIPPKWLQQRKTILILSICISLLGGYIPIGYHMSIHRAMCFLPFFVMGYYSTDIDLRKYINKIPSYIAVGILIAFFAFTSITTGHDYVLYIFCPYREWEESPVFTVTTFPIIRCMLLGSAVILSVMALRLVRDNSFFAKWGEKTLFIYIFHALALKLLFPLINRNYLPQNEWLLLVYAILIIMGLLYLSRYKVFYLLLNPISSFREYMSKVNLNNSEK